MNKAVEIVQKVLMIGLVFLGAAGMLLVLHGLSLSTGIAQAARGPEEAAFSGAAFPETYSAGYFHSCAIRSDHTVVCWGAGMIDTDSDPDFGQSMAPSGSFTQISAGDFHTCGIKTDGSLACWGAGMEGDAGGIHFGQSIPPVGLGRVNQVSAGGRHTCAVKADGSVACWGKNTEQQSSAPSGVFTQVERRRTSYLRVER
jgi:alpha-tubulin suppressor-like RCC1 family protein